MVLSRAETQGRARRGGGWTTLLLLSPSVLMLVAFLLIPLFIVVKYSFSGSDPYGGVTSNLTLENYRALFRPLYVPIFLRSVELAAAPTLVSLLVGYPVAYFLAFRAGRFAPLLLMAMIVPFWTNFLVRISAWMTLLNDQGVINATLQAVGLTGRPLRMVPTSGAVLVGLLYAFLPSAVFPIYASLRSVEPSLLEAAKDLGCGAIATHRRIVLPVALPGIVAAALLVFIPALGVFVIPVLLGGGKQIMIGNLIVTLYLEFRNIPFGAAISVVLLLIVSIGIAGFLKLSGAARRFA